MLFVFVHEVGFWCGASLASRSQLATAVCRCCGVATLISRSPSRTVSTLTSALRSRSLKTRKRRRRGRRPRESPRNPTSGAASSRGVAPCFSPLAQTGARCWSFASSRCSLFLPPSFVVRQ
ncbi:unnamed protein product [Ectocarpus sp. 6 AP-2014]